MEVNGVMDTAVAALQNQEAQLVKIAKNVAAGEINAKNVVGMKQAQIAMQADVQLIKNANEMYDHILSLL